MTQDMAYLDAITRRVLALMRADRDGADTAARLFAALLADLSQTGEPPPSGRTDPRSLRAERAVAEAAGDTLENPGLTPLVAAMATDAGQSVPQFLRLFRHYHGISPKRFAVRATMARAQELLQESGRSVTDVAAMLGYSSPQFFARQLTPHFRRPPSADRGGTPVAVRKVGALAAPEPARHAEAPAALR